MSGLLAVADVPRKMWDCDLLSDLKTHLMVLLVLTQIPAELVRCWWTVERRVVADCAKERSSIMEVLAILAQALPREVRVGILPRIDLVMRAFGGPG